MGFAVPDARGSGGRHYRSLRSFVVPLQRLNLITGPNGSGKLNVYRALRLLAETAQGRVIPSLAREGGLERADPAACRAPPGDRRPARA
jgi:ABC-type iron transport system FetAB ATPase subunit